MRTWMGMVLVVTGCELTDAAATDPEPGALGSVEQPQLTVAVAGQARFARSLETAGERATLAGLASDVSGRVVAAGGFEDSLEVGGVALVSAGATDAFVAGYDSFGMLRFARSWGDAAVQEVSAIAAAPNGRTIIAGNFEGILDFGGGIVLTAAGPPSQTFANDAFVALLGPNGQVLWARHLVLEDGDGILRATQVASDRFGNVLVSGPVEGHSTIGGIDFGDGILRNYLVKLDSVGQALWARLYPGPDQEVVALETDAAGNIVALSHDTRGTDLLIHRWQPSGAPAGEAIFPAVMPEQLALAHDLAVTPSGFLYVAGEGAFGVSATGGQSFVALIDPNLDLVDLQVFSGRLVRRLVLAPVGQLAIAGDQVVGTPPFTLRLPFVARLPFGGGPVWLRLLGGHGRITALSAAPVGSLHVGGNFDEIIDPGSGALTNTGEPDLFLTALRP